MADTKLRSLRKPFLQ